MIYLSKKFMIYCQGKQNYDLFNLRVGNVIVDRVVKFVQKAINIRWRVTANIRDEERDKTRIDIVVVRRKHVNAIRLENRVVIGKNRGWRDWLIK